VTDPEEERPRARLTREDLGSWLSGPGAVIGTDQDYRGQRLGLPESGPGSVAGFGRRLVALVIDWLACLVLVRLFLPHIDYGTPDSSLATLGFFLAELTLFTWLVGASFGQRLLGLAVVRLDGGGGPGLLRALLRSVQICLVVPAVIWDRDSRGLHDRSMGTVVVRR
jgi:uncharacterized RDD family membrane protein YckC